MPSQWWTKLQHSRRECSCSTGRSSISQQTPPVSTGTSTVRQKSGKLRQLKKLQSSCKINVKIITDHQCTYSPTEPTPTPWEMSSLVTGQDWQMFLSLIDQLSSSRFSPSNKQWRMLAKGNPQWPQVTNEKHQNHRHLQSQLTSRQAFYPMENVETVNPGDILTARCTYNSMGRNTATKIGLCRSS